MNLSNKGLIAVLAFSVFFIEASRAADTTISVSGKVVAASCTVSSELQSGQEVDLGTVGRTHFLHANDAGNWQNFSLKLADCAASTSKATVTFTGTPDGTDSTLFANTESTETAATNMAVQIAKESDHSAVLSNASTMTIDIDSSSQTATFPLAARLYTPTGNVSPGNVSSSVVVNFTYQ